MDKNSFIADVSALEHINGCMILYSDFDLDCEGWFANMNIM